VGGGGSARKWEGGGGGGKGTNVTTRLTAQLPDTSSTVWLKRPLMVPLRLSMDKIIFCLQSGAAATAIGRGWGG
jgi:hypothetical protein